MPANFSLKKNVTPLPVKPVRIKDEESKVRSMAKPEIMASAKRTIGTELAGLTALHNALDNGLSESFAEAIETLRSIKGRVVVTGVGKSGHIGSKIAATLASTGTPAFFVHPAEANHGDLGMITEHDAILAMSWSGETAELSGILSYSRRFNIPLIALTSSNSSTLSNQSDIVLLLPKEQEACPHNLAPTTSSMMQLAIGDAIAVALLESGEFTATRFRDFHPGGKLGASLTHIRDVMHSAERLPLKPLGTPMTEAIIEITEKGFGCVGITKSDGTLAGIITDGDLRRHMGTSILERKAEDIMSKRPKTVEPDMLAVAALDLMNSKNITALMVLDAEKPVGIIHLHDLLRIGVA